MFGAKGTMGFSVMAVLVASTALGGQEKPTLTPEDYGKWETPTAVALSPDGTWLVYGLRRVNEEDELRIRALDEDTARIVPFGSGPTFEGGSGWLAYRIGLPPEERDEEGARDGMGLLDLRTRADTTFADVSSFDFSEDGEYLAILRDRSEGEGGGDLIVRELATGSEVPLGNVASHGWSPEGHLLAMTLETASGSGNGVQLFDAGAGVLRLLDRGETAYRALTWRDDDDDLVVLRAVEEEGFDDETHQILLWRDLASGAGASQSFDPAVSAGFPTDMRVTEFQSPSWSADGGSLFFRIRPRERSPEVIDSSESAPPDSMEAEDEVEPSDVQIWHANDKRIIPMQRAQERRDLERGLLSVWHVDEDRFLQLGTDLMADAEVLEGGRHVTEADETPYVRDVMFGRPWSDVYLVDTRSGERTRILERIRHVAGGSPEGRYVLYFHGEDWWAFDVVDGESRNLTESLRGSFADHEYDYPVTQLPPVGFRPAGWIDGDRAVLLRDASDVWAVSPGGEGGQRLTDGSGEGIEYAVPVLDPEQDSFDSGQPLYLSLFGDRTKQSGFGRVRLDWRDGLVRGGSVERLLLEDASLAGLAKASDADVYLFGKQRFDDAPDVFVAGPDFADVRQVTHTNPFQDDYAWGHAEVVDFVSEGGVDLQATLLYPAEYEPGRRYPMIVYTYEKLSDGMHRYIVPSERSYYNYQVWTQQGYFVLQPDIVYKPRDPGVSAVEAVVPAVKKIVDMGLVDPERVGLVGHSWGGYQATYIPTRTNIFAAAVAGAPLTNFLSMVGAVHWRPGLPEFAHWETGQARMGVPQWEDFEAHVRNSPAAHIQDLETPMLMMFGDEDGTVDFRQGVEFYNYARRAGKEFVMLVYPGADHGLRQEPNQVDYHRRILQWFGHYLKGEPAAPWMTDGVSWLERKRELGGGG